MIDRKTISLINGEVDGENTPEESEILNRTLARDPEARKLLEDLKKLERNFASISPVETPSTLKKSIMRSIHERPVPVKRGKESFRLLDLLFPVRTLPRLGFAFSGGVLAGILLVIVYFTFVSHPQIDVRDVSGTVLGSSEGLQTADDEKIASDGAVGRVTTEYSSTVSVLRVNLAMRPDLTARFLFDPDGARLKGVSMADEFQGTLTQQEGVLEVGHGGGEFRAFFTPASPAQNVRFQLVSAGNVLYEQTLPLKKFE